MKLLLVIFSIFATSFATGPATPACIEKAAACLDVAALVNIPTIDIGVNINLLGLVTIGVDAKLDCTFLAAQVRLATELSYNESASGDTVTFNLVLQVALNADLNLDADVVVKSLLGIKIGVGLCVVGYVDVVINLNITGTYQKSGNPSDCKIKEVDCDGGHGGSWVNSSGDSVCTDAVDSCQDEIKDKCFTKTKDCLNDIWKKGLVSA